MLRILHKWFVVQLSVLPTSNISAFKNHYLGIDITLSHLVEYILEGYLTQHFSFQYPEHNIQLNMDLKVTGKCFAEQGSGMVFDEAWKKAPVKSILFCKMTPFIITEDGNIDSFESGKMDAIYQADDQYFWLSLKNRSGSYKLRRAKAL